MTLLGPIHHGRRGHAFAAAARDVGAECYLEEEFVLEGTAVPYEWPIGRTPAADGRWRVVEGDARPFRTRVLIRRPFDPAHFNGCVVVVWVDVTAGFDVLEWETDEALNGCAWAFVSAQHVGVHGWRGTTDGGLVGWDPERYGTLHIDHDDLSYDIFTQAAEAVGPHRAPPDRPGDVDPLGGLDVQYVMAAGSGQGAARLATYRNAIQSRTEAFDAFLLDRWFGTAAPLGDDPVTQRDDAAARAARDERTHRGEHLLRTDLEVPTLVFLTESEVPACAHVRQPDDEQLRVWEIAGASHCTAAGRRRLAAQLARDLPDATPEPCTESTPGPYLNDFDERPARDAAIRALCDWIATGEAPAEQPRLRIEASTGVVARDRDGNAEGGIRLPDFAAPLARRRGRNDRPGAAGLCGAVEPFTRDELVARYPTIEAYLEQYERAARAAHRAGVLLPRERDRLVETARRLPRW